MRRLLLPLVLAFTTADLIIFVAAHLPWANGPAEWKWAYHAPGLSGFGLLLAAALVVPLLWLAGGEKARDARWALPLLAVLGWALTLDVARGQEGGFRRVMDALASRHTFGYAFDEGLAPSARELFAGYPAATAGLNQHSRTHPPGALLLVRGLDQIGRRLPSGKLGGLETVAAESMEREVERASVRRQPAPRQPPAPVTLVLLAMLLPALSALAAWPLHRLAVRLGLPPGAALLAVAFWLLTPARSLFTPSLDQALPFLILAAAALAAGPGRWRAFASGLVLFLGLFVSYGVLAAAVLVLLLAFWAEPAASGASVADVAEPPGRSERWRRAAVRPALLATGLLLPWLALAVFAGYDPWTSFTAAVAQHRAIAVAPRSYTTWLLWNPYDLALLLGPAVLGLTVAALRRPAGAKTETTERQAEPTRRFAWGWWALLALLLVSGSVRGEAGRIWLMLMPFACLLAAGAAEERWGRRNVWAALFLVLQAALLLTLAANMTFMS
jgi:hypothetical protein